MSPVVTVDMSHVAVEDIKQNDIADADANKLCLALCDIQLAGSILLGQKAIARPFNLADINRIVDKAIANGGIASVDGINSDSGWVKSHEKIAEAAGLFGYVKKYAPFDPAKIFALLQWKSLVELRDEGRHSLLATSWFKGEDGIFYCRTSDPWRPTNDTLLDTSRALTLRKDRNGNLVPSRSIEYIGYYVRNGTDWI